jgi:hypothetical protein
MRLRQFQPRELAKTIRMVASLRNQKLICLNGFQIQRRPQTLQPTELVVFVVEDIEAAKVACLRPAPRRTVQPSLNEPLDCSDTLQWGNSRPADWAYLLWQKRTRRELSTLAERTSHVNLQRLTPIIVK